ncbi:hypothetical protein CHS0354_026195 [Potamilus streckersoni]|uniref:Peptidase M12B domain-containing protein n=1 Tax=Potamilus streckersoni TaxID=2493646 RepID=A0AAE0SF12_9BIVA|nr:hypothetical protein CHS0354_026195 [Potamilus streckersoni]
MARTFRVTIPSLARAYVLGYAFSLVYGFTLPGSEDGDQVEEIVELGPDYLTYDHRFENDWSDSTQYYFRSDTNSQYRLLRKNPSIDLNAPFCFNSDIGIKCFKGNEQNIHFYTDEFNRMAVSISNKEGTLQMHGVVLSNNSIHSIQPAVMLEQRNQHIIKKRAASLMINIKLYPTDKRLANSIPEKKEYIVDILAVVDYSIYKKMKDLAGGNENATESKIRFYFAHVLNGVNLRYATINRSTFSITVRLAGFFIAKEPSDLSFIQTYDTEDKSEQKVDGKTTLKGFTKFLQKTKDLPEYNHAILFVEYTATNSRGSILGTSFLSDICTFRSVSLVVDHGAYTPCGIAAHELGHNLGVRDHDGSGVAKNCPASKNCIMSPSSALIDQTNLENSFQFSECSIDQMEKLLRAKDVDQTNCLTKPRRVPQIQVFIKPLLATMPGEVTDVHAQCRELYGEKSFMCPPQTADEMCYRMYCYDPTHEKCAIVSEQMAAMGSPCGNKKWCYLGKCIHDEKAPSGIDDCPYPDLPPPGANCKDARAITCKNPLFRNKCCQSCNKDFSKEKVCEDTSIKINGLLCKDLVSTYGPQSCSSGEVHQYCCKSCQDVLSGNTCEDTSIRINDLGCQEFILRYGAQACATDNIRTYCCSSCQSATQSSQSSVKSSRKTGSITLIQVSTSSRKSSCEDNTMIRINGMDCSGYVSLYRVQACRQPTVRQNCCGSCLPYD